ncbi:hypothetical protein PENSUB_4660 [Penicillium subrubescens]|uniref:Uncharacterized protein n=1 Tax=Penicillium subrubescens TaxID=1316194 RepID=A0A1Q5UBT7_9EURO|nr:hypothetical protein PENSUB_4660 [Penicillium subrubescens]
MTKGRSGRSAKNVCNLLNHIPKVMRCPMFHEVLALGESVQNRSNNIKGMEAQWQQDFKPVLRRSVDACQCNPVMIVNKIRCQYSGPQINLRQQVDRGLRSRK